MSVNRYTNTPVVNDPDTGKRNYSTTIFPSIPQSDGDTFITSKDGDRLDLLASRFYGDSTLWWIIGVSNGLTESFYVPPGTRLRIPSDVQFALSYLKDINESR